MTRRTTIYLTVAFIAALLCLLLVETCNAQSRPLKWQEDIRKEDSLYSLEHTLSYRLHEAELQEKKLSSMGVLCLKRGDMKLAQECSVKLIYISGVIATLKDLIYLRGEE